jgi:CheY-like chemotaxis protein
MDWSEDQIRQQLKDRRILVIENDRDLAPSIKDLFLSYGADDVVIKRCAVGSTEGGLDALRERGHDFHLVVVDIMLPWDEDALRRYDHLQEKRNHLQNQAAELRHKKNVQGRLANLRNEVQWLEKASSKEIDDDAGVKMIAQWRAIPEDPGVGHLIPKPPMLFLTARQETSFGEDELAKIRQHTRWLTKPVLELQMLAAAAELVAEFDELKRVVPCG